jgi:sugar lactone lactonase YvrE
MKNSINKPPLSVLVIPAMCPIMKTCSLFPLLASCQSRRNHLQSLCLTFLLFFACFFSAQPMGARAQVTFISGLPAGAHTQLNYATPYTFTTLAGDAGNAGSADGIGRAARFNNPNGVAVDTAGNVYVADSGNHTIRKVTPAGAVTTLAGLAGSPGSADGTGSAARFFQPSGLAADPAGNLYVADSRNSTIRLVTSAGTVTTLAGIAGSPGNTDGPSSAAESNAAQFCDPHDVAVDRAGNVYVADTANQRIRKVTTKGIVVTIAGPTGSPFDRVGWTDGAGDKARFNYPWSVAVDPAGNVFVADRDNDTIRKITPAREVTTFVGTAQVGWTNVGTSTYYRLPSRDGTGTAVQFGAPSGVAMDNTGNLYVADQAHSTIRMVTSAGMVTTLAGKADEVGSADGTGSAAQFDMPNGVAVDSAGNVYVADPRSHTIRKGIRSKAGASTKASVNP